MFSLTRKALESHEDTKVCYICRIRFLKKLFRDKNYQKVRGHWYYTGKHRSAAHSICNLKFNEPNEIAVVFHRGSNYEYHFIIKELANEFEREFECIDESKENYKNFFVPIKKEIIKNDKDKNKTDKNISYKINFIDSARFMGSSLSNLVDNIKEWIHKIKCKDWGCFLEYEHVKGSLTVDKCLCFNKCYLKKFNEGLKRNSRTYLSCLIMTSINLFCC